MSDVNDPLSWVTRAEEDYDVACTSLRRKKPYTHTRVSMRSSAPKNT